MPRLTVTVEFWQGTASAERFQLFHLTVFQDDCHLYAIIVRLKMKKMENGELFSSSTISPFSCFVAIDFSVLM